MSFFPSSYPVFEGVFSGPRSWKRSVEVGATFAIQAAAAAGILIAGYSLAGSQGVSWAVVSAIIVLQPELQQSLSTSLLRIAANIIGASVGLVVGWWIGVGPWQWILALVATSFACGLLRLDAALRTACVASIIVMTAGKGHLAMSVAERFASVTIGCVIAVGIQLTTYGLLKSIKPDRRLKEEKSADAGE